MKLLIDADLLLYTYGSISEFSCDWGDGTVCTYTSAEEAINGAKDFLSYLMDLTQAQDMILCFSNRDRTANFRKRLIDPSYKHNRPDDRPELYETLRTYLEANYAAKEVYGLEADDILGILSTSNPGKFIICTVDKDLTQIPGHILLWHRVPPTVKLITSDEADFQFYKQVLMGDPTDGYPGCPGIGQVKAERLLAQTPKDEWWDAIVKEYGKKNLPESYAITQARLARILRNSDWDCTLGWPKLWTPSS